MNATKELLKEAEQAARETESWADLSNFLFNPVDGLVAKAYPTRAAREAFVQTEEYRKIRRLISEAMERHGLVEGATPKKTERLTIQLPRTLRAALEIEATEEGVSLEQLVLAKLAVGLGRLTGLALPAEEQDKRGIAVVPTRA
jgi:hypothetical protein